MEKLQFVTDLLDSLNQNNVNYCHFKSNEHLDAAISGDTDLDILFAYNDAEKANEILLAIGFKKFNTAWFVNYPYVADYIAIEKGKIIHVHAHFRLIIGESKVKSYILPWDIEILENRVFDEEHSIYTSNPVDEMLLLIVRTALKLPGNSINYDKKRDIIDGKREFEWLRNRVKKEKLSKLSETKFGEKICAVVENIYDQSINYNNIRKFHKIAEIELKKHRRFSFLQSKVIRFTRRSAQIFSLINRKYSVIPNLKNHRTLNSKGLIITLMGADGSGKSTQVNNITNLLRKKMDVRYVYMGSGNGPSSWHRFILKIGKDFLVNKNKETKYKDATKKHSTSGLNFKKILNAIYYTSLAIEKKTKLNKLDKYRNKGMICVTDRYPQIQLFGYNDGLHMHDWLTSRNFILRRIAEFEYNCYHLSTKIEPNIVFKLIGDPEVLHQRRKEMNLEEIEKKQQGIKDITFSNNVKTYEINAENKIEDTTAYILDMIGEEIKNSIN